MTPLVEWLLDLDRIRVGRDAPLILKWHPPIEGWVLFCLVVPALVWIALMYRREEVSRVRRAVPAALRCAIVALVAVVICRPSLVLQRNRVEPSYVAVVLDTSESMSTADRYHGESSAGEAGLHEVADPEGQSRLALVRAALLRDEAAPVRALLERNGIQLCTFAGHVRTQGFYLPSFTAGPGPAPQALVDAIQDARATGTTTDLAGAIKQIVEKTQGRRLAAIVLASDGQATRPTGLKDALDAARDRQIPVFPLRVGVTDVPWDVRVVSARARDKVFVNDLLAVGTQLTAQGLNKPTPVTVRLLDDRDGTLLSSERVVIDPQRPSVSVELTTKPTRTGSMRYRVEVQPDPDELTAENNVERLDVQVVDRRFSVLYVDGYPRYEYRYLKNALLRERTIELSVLLIEADERFIQEGTDPIRRFPVTPEELNRYDVVLFGDVDPQGGWLSTAQMKMLLDFVGNEGGGFGLIAGERAAPRRFLGTPLEKLIPVRIDPTFLGVYDTALTSGFHPRLTMEGRRSRIFRFATDRAESERLFEELPPLYWFARTLGPKPGASVLLEHSSVRAGGVSEYTRRGSMPLVVTGRYGAGKLFFQATDDTWRWRRHTGDFLHDSYWVQIARELMPGPGTGRSRRFVLQTDRRVYPFGSSVRARVEILDSQLLAKMRDMVRISVVSDRKPRPPSYRRARHAESAPTDGATPPHSPREEAAPVADEDLAPSVVVGRFEAHRISPESSLFEGTWVPPRPGSFVVRVVDIASTPGEPTASVAVRVNRPDLEARRPQADHETLEHIAAATGGRVLELDELEQGFRTIRDRSVQIPDDIEEPLWDSKLVLMLFVTMISMEWVLRKAFGLA